MNKLLVGNKCDLTTKKVVDYTTAKVCNQFLNMIISHFHVCALGSVYSLIGAYQADFFKD